MAPATARGYGRRVAEDEHPRSDVPEPASEDEDVPSTPFDHPFFLPVLLIGFALWFFYDGWFNPDMEWLKFNRYGFAILAVAATYYTVRAVREVRGWECSQCGSRNKSELTRCAECGGETRPA